MANVAPASLAKEFRSMLMRVAQQLSEDEMTRIAYEEGFTLELPPSSSGLQDMRVHFLHKLEAKGVFSPRNPDGLLAILQRLSKEELVSEVNTYKQNPLFGKTNKKQKVKKKPSKDAQKVLEGGSESRLRGDNVHGELEDMFALAMTHASSLMTMLEELQQLMQGSLPLDKIAEVAPQVREAITVLSKEEQIVGLVCKSIKKVVSETEVSAANSKKPVLLKGGKKKVDMPVSTMHSKTYKRPLAPSPPTTNKQLTQSLGCPLSPTEPEEEYSEITSMATMGQGYETCDQVLRRHAPKMPPKPPPKPPAHQREALYKNVTPQEDVSFYGNTVPLTPQRDAFYENTDGDSREVVPEACYDEIIDPTEVDEDNYGTVRHSDSGTGSGSGGAEPKDWLRSKPLEEELVGNL